MRFPSIQRGGFVASSAASISENSAASTSVSASKYLEKIYAKSVSSNFSVETLSDYYRTVAGLR